MKQAICIIIAVVGTFLMSYGTAWGYCIITVALLGMLNIPVFFDHKEIGRSVLVPILITLGFVLLIYTFFIPDKHAELSIKHDGGYYVAAKLSKIDRGSVRAGRHRHEYTEFDFDDYRYDPNDSTKVHREVITREYSLKDIKEGDTFILATTLDRKESIIWNMNPTRDEIKAYAYGKFVYPNSSKLSEFMNKFWREILIILIVGVAVASQMSSISTIILLNLTMIFLFTRFYEPTFTMFAILFFIFLALILFPYQRRLLADVNKYGGYLTKAILYKKSDFQYCIKLRDWNNKIYYFNAAKLQGFAKLFETQSEAIVILPLGIERAPIIVQEAAYAYSCLDNGGIFVEKFDIQNFSLSSIASYADSKRLRQKHEQSFLTKESL